MEDSALHHPTATAAGHLAEKREILTSSTVKSQTINKARSVPSGFWDAATRRAGCSPQFNPRTGLMGKEVVGSLASLITMRWSDSPKDKEEV